jgi:hypothetical protein
MNSREKLSQLKEMAEPMARTYLADLGGVGAMAAALLAPQAEVFVERFLNLPADVIDAELARIVDFVGRLRSDDAPAVVAHPGGAIYLDANPRPGEVCLAPAGDRVSAPGFRHGQDGVREVAPGPDDL